jgi:hypothetical protein
MNPRYYWNPYWWGPFVDPRWGYPPVDPPPIDLASQVRIFERYLADILRAGGHDETQLHKATVGDLVSAYRASIAPAPAHPDTRGVTAAQVASMNRGELESLKLHLHSETIRLGSLAKIVEQRLGELK